MKKLLFLLLCTVSIYGQTYQNPTFGTVTTKTNTESTTATRISAQETSGLINWLQPINIPIPITPANYTITAPTLGAHLIGIDNKFLSVTATTAGISTRVWFTADVSVVSATNYYATNATSKGTLASAIQNVVNNDNVKTYFAQDLIGSPFATATMFPPGTYAGNLSASTSPNSAQQRWTVELYKCDNAGTPIASGVTGAVVGSLGVTVITILDSGLLTLADGSVTNVQVSGTLGTGGLSMAVGQRIRYHVSAEKVGTAGANITQSVYYGTSYNSFLDVPVPLNTTAVQNLSTVVGNTTTDALNLLNAGAFTSTEKTNVLSQYLPTDVNYPADITFRPFKITEYNGAFYVDKSVKDLVRDKIAKMKPYYCNYETGSDSNDGLTEATATKTIFYTYTTLGARLIYLTGGVHKSDSWNTNINPSYTNTDDFFIIAKKPTYITSAGTATPTLISGSAYRMSGGSYRTLVDMKYIDKKGFPLRLLEVATAGDVLTTPGSYYIDIAGSTIDFRLSDSRVPDANALALTRGGANYRANTGYHYVEGVTFIGGGVNGSHGMESQTTASTAVALNYDCKFLYGYGTGYTSNGGEGFRAINNLINWSENCIAYGNARDGYNYVSNSTTRMGIVEVNCQGFYNGTKLLSGSVNGSSAHNVCDVIRINGKHYQNSGPNVIDIDGAIAVNYGVTAFESIAPLTADNVDFNNSSNVGTPPSKQYNYKVKSYNSTSFKVGGSLESHIINKDVFYKGALVTTTPAAPQTITFADFPTADITSTALPNLSSYTALGEYAPIASPTFTGDPKAPTPTAGDNDTSIANTAFVNGAMHWTKTGNDIRNNNSGAVELKPLARVSILNASNVETAYVTNTGTFMATQKFALSDGASGMSFDNSSLIFTDYGNSTFKFNPIYLNQTIGGGTRDIIGFTNQTVNPTSGTISYNFFNSSPIINQTGGASGITRSIYINPTLTSAFDYRAIEVVTGNTLLDKLKVNAPTYANDAAADADATLLSGMLYKITGSRAVYQKP
jgi:hypothetical protein